MELTKREKLLYGDHFEETAQFTDSQIIRNLDVEDSDSILWCRTDVVRTSKTKPIKLYLNANSTREVLLDARRRLAEHPEYRLLYD